MRVIILGMLSFGIFFRCGSAPILNLAYAQHVRWETEKEKAERLRREENQRRFDEYQRQHENKENQPPSSEPSPDPSTCLATRVGNTLTLNYQDVLGLGRAKIVVELASCFGYDIASKPFAFRNALAEALKIPSPVPSKGVYSVTKKEFDLAMETN